MKWTVNIVEHETERVVKTFSLQGSRRAAEQLDRGININLDHRHYYTEIVEIDEREEILRALATETQKLGGMGY